MPERLQQEVRNNPVDRDEPAGAWRGFRFARFVAQGGVPRLARAQWTQAEPRSNQGMQRYAFILEMRCGGETMNAPKPRVDPWYRDPWEWVLRLGICGLCGTALLYAIPWASLPKPPGSKDWLDVLNTVVAMFAAVATAVAVFVALYIAWLGFAAAKAQARNATLHGGVEIKHQFERLADACNPPDLAALKIRLPLLEGTWSRLQNIRIEILDLPEASALIRLRDICGVAVGLCKLTLESGRPWPDELAARLARLQQEADEIAWAMHGLEPPQKSRQ